MAGQPFTLFFSHQVKAQPLEAFARPDWDCWTFEYILQGTGTLTVGGCEYAPVAGDLYVLPKGLPHRYQADKKDPWCKLFFVIDGPLIRSLLTLYQLEDLHHVSNCESHSLFLAMKELWDQHPEDLHEQASILFHRLLAALARRRRPAPYSRPVHQALRFIEQHVEAPVTIEQIAAAARQSRSHLTRCFKKEVGLAPYELLIRQRMTLAKALLLRTDLTIAEIANRLCYADAYYFSNAFKQHTGRCPSHYRQDPESPRHG